ncbi:MAG: LAGLIDADG family homing endonuclease [Fusobacteriaceae bacterium]
MTNNKEINAYKWLNENNLGYDIWNTKYRFQNETFEAWLDRVSGNDLRLREAIKNKKFLFGGRTLASRGTNNGQSYSNCYSSGYAHDSVEGMMNLNTNLALTYQKSGGQGLSLSKVRPKGSDVRGGLFKSDGIIPFMEIFNQTTASISQGGCIHEDELVLTKTGYKKIKDIIIGDYAWTKKGFIEINHLFDKGIQEVFEVVTRKGYKIRTTADHKYCVDGFNTKKLSELLVGDKINLIAKQANSKNNFDGLSYFLGYFNGNGSVNNNKNGGNLTMHSSQKEIGDRLISIINELGFNAYYINKDASVNTLNVYIVKDFIDFLAEKNFIRNKNLNIEIFDSILLGDDSKKASYLAGALDSDGTIYDTSIKYSTTSKSYAEQMILLMSSLGFFPSINVENRDDNSSDLFSVIDSFRPGQVEIPSIKIKNKRVSFAKNSKLSTPYSIENAEIPRNLSKELTKISKIDNIELHTYLNATIGNEEKFFKPMVFDDIVSISQIENAHVYDISLVEEHLFDCNGIYVSNSRKGALMMSLTVWHPEIMDFISVKDGSNKITKANLSVEIDNEFMNLVKKGSTSHTHVFMNKEHTINPTEIYNEIMRRAWSSAEPGVIYTDRFRNYNFMEFDADYEIVTGNPCGEQPLPKDGACNLGSINLAAYVDNAFTKDASFKMEEFGRDVEIFVRALDDVLEEGKDFHALQTQRDMAKNYRNIGLGVMGYATMLMMIGKAYGEEDSNRLTDHIFGTLLNTSIAASAHIAKEKGAFPKINKRSIVASEIFKEKVHPSLHEYVSEVGMRNCSLLSVAPSGSIGTMLNVSTGLEPYYALKYTRKTESLHNGEDVYYEVEVPTAKKAREAYGEDVLISAMNLDWRKRVDVQAIMQDFLDTAISSTVNVPEEATVEDLHDLYIYSWEKGLKGITIYREGSFEAILNSGTKKPEVAAEMDDDFDEDKCDLILAQDVFERGVMMPIPEDTYYIPKDMMHGCGRGKVMIGVSPEEKRVTDVYVIPRGEGGCSKNIQGEAILISQILRLGGNLHDVKKTFRGVEACASCIMAKNRGKQVDGINCPNILIGIVLDIQDSLKNMWLEDEAEHEIIPTKTVSKASNVKKHDDEKVGVGKECPECGAKLYPTGGCWQCNCGFSYCG